MSASRNDPRALSAFRDSAIDHARLSSADAETVKALLNVTQNELSRLRASMRSDGLSAATIAAFDDWGDIESLLNLAIEKVEAVADHALAIENGAIGAAGRASDA